MNKVQQRDWKQFFIEIFQELTSAISNSGHHKHFNLLLWEKRGKTDTSLHSQKPYRVLKNKKLNT